MADADDLKKSVEAAGKAAEAIRLPKSTIESLGNLSKVGRMIGSQMRLAESVRRPPGLDEDVMRWMAEKENAPIHTRRAVEAMLEEVQEGAERERRMLRLTEISVAVAAVGVLAAIATVALVLIQG